MEIIFQVRNMAGVFLVLQCYDIYEYGCNEVKPAHPILGNAFSRYVQ
jgi:hypothetical protein